MVIVRFWNKTVKMEYFLHKNTATVWDFSAKKCSKRLIIKQTPNTLVPIIILYIKSTGKGNTFFQYKMQKMKKNAIIFLFYCISIK